MGATERRGRAEAGRELTAYAAELERSNQELERFAAVAAHELHEPLRAVAGFAALLERRYRGRLDAGADELIGLVTGGVARMQALVDGLLAWARAGSATGPGPAGPVDAEEVADQAIANLRPAVAESGAIVDRGPLPVVDGDAGQLVQLFQNLIGNAVKFRSRHPPLVRVRAEPADGWWRFAVADNGIGMGPELAERAFDLFWRGHGRDRYPGAGIGLAVFFTLPPGGGQEG